MLELHLSLITIVCITEGYVYSYCIVLQAANRSLSIGFKKLDICM